jgi:pimeloyl-ACP methyl ester carboxylesterase
MGAAITLNLALDHPQHLLGLGLVGGAPRLKVNPALIDHAASPTTYYNAIESVVSWSFSAAMPATFTDQVAKRMAATRPSVLHADFLACDAWDVTGRVEQVRCPSLVMCGSEDRMTPLRHSQYLANTIPGARLEIIDGAGHMPQLEQPLAVAEIVQDFLMDLVY